MGALGILLIVLLFLLHLTVASGTINGLLFYVNIIQANHQIFLPTATTHQFKYFYLHTVFIGWLNLDFGIEICFYKDMDIFAYSWLQFLFPIYLWILMLIIIISARYSHRVSKRLGHNLVAVLATVLLISYGKMLQAIIVPFSWVELKIATQESSNSELNISTKTVWLYHTITTIMWYWYSLQVLLFSFSSFLTPFSFSVVTGYRLNPTGVFSLGSTSLSLSWMHTMLPIRK